MKDFIVVCNQDKFKSKINDLKQKIILFTINYPLYKN
jgi:hypothetical protein